MPSKEITVIVAHFKAEVCDFLQSCNTFSYRRLMHGQVSKQFCMLIFKENVNALWWNGTEVFYFILFYDFTVQF